MNAYNIYNDVSRQTIIISSVIGDREEMSKESLHDIAHNQLQNIWNNLSDKKEWIDKAIDKAIQVVRKCELSHRELTKKNTKANTPSEGHKYSKLVRSSSTDAKKRGRHQSLNTEKDNDNSDTMVPENKSQNKKRKKYPLIMQIDGESIDLGSFATLGELKERRRVFIESIKDDD